MISYEKTAQALKTSTIVVIVLNILAFILGLFSLLGIFSIQRAIKTGTIDNYHLSAEQLAAFKQSITPLSITLIILTIIINIVITVLCFMNLSKLKRKQAVSFIPYYLGIGLATFNIVHNLIFNTFTIASFLIQAAYIVFYFYAIQKARLLADKDEEEVR